MISHYAASDYAPAVTRIGLSLVVLWFGVNQLINPGTFRGYLPGFLLSLSYAKTIVLLNGVFEIVFGGLLLLGLFTKLSSLLIGLHLIGIIIGMGYNDIAVRDVGLMIVSFGIYLGGADKWSLDYKRRLA